jgi:ubiquinone/menaquinone biosynthesis C-methylase UbiE
MNYQRLYDAFAPVYAPAMRLLPVWLKYAQQALPWLPSAGPILEVGPGPGVLHTQLAKTYPVTIGADLSFRMLQQTQRRLRGAAQTDRLVQANVMSLPFASNSFDGIILTFVFSAFPDGSAAMCELSRLLRPAGRLVIVDACIPRDRNLIARGLGRMWTLFGDYVRDESALMQAAGLDVIERREYGVFNSVGLSVGCKP